MGPPQKPHRVPENFKRGPLGPIGNLKGGPKKKLLRKEERKKKPLCKEKLEVSTLKRAIQISPERKRLKEPVNP